MSSENAMPKPIVRPPETGRRKATPFAPLGTTARRTRRRRAGVVAAPPVAAKRQRRRPLMRRMLSLRTVLVVTFVTAFVVAGYGIKQSGLLGIRHVDVVGAQVLNERVLVERSGLKGRYLLTADLGAAKRRLEELPLVARAEVERSWPVGVRIRIYERQGWALWERGGRRYVVDADGHILQNVEAPPNSPTILDVRDGDSEAVEAAQADVVRAVRELRDRMPAVAGLQPRLFRFEEGRGLIVTASDGRTAIFGDGADLEYKLAVWRAVLRASEAELVPRAWVEVVDLRYGDRPSMVNAIGKATAAPAPRARAAATATATASPKPAATATGQPRQATATPGAGPRATTGPATQTRPQ